MIPLHLEISPHCVSTRVLTASILDLGRDRCLVFEAILAPGRAAFELVSG